MKFEMGFRDGLMHPKSESPIVPMRYANLFCQKLKGRENFIAVEQEVISVIREFLPGYEKNTTGLVSVVMSKNGASMRHMCYKVLKVVERWYNVKSHLAFLIHFP